MDFLVAYLSDMRRAEAAKATSSEIVRRNGWKGYIPQEARDGVQLRVVSDHEGKKLASMGYTRLGDYRGSGTETGRKGYYFSVVGGNNTYHQGVMHTAQTSGFGVDPRTGRTLSGITAGKIPNDMVDVVTNRLRANQGRRRASGEPLLPIYGEDGKVIGYERSILPERLAALERNSHLGEMIGAWSGRQAEEELAQGFNRILVDRTWDVWQRDRKKGRAKEFVDLSDPDLEQTEPTLAEAWKLVPSETRSYIRQKFGDDGFMVRRDMIDNTVGYRALSVGDLWSQVAQLDKGSRKAFVDTATVVLGKNAFPYLVRAEKLGMSV